jgi:hypothetical protein
MASPPAPRILALQRLALHSPGTAAAAAPAPTLVPRAPRPSTAPPPPLAVALGRPRGRASNSNKRKRRRILQFAQLLLESLPAHPTTLRHGTPSGATSAVRPPPSPVFTPASPPFAPPPEPSATAQPADQPAIADAAPPLEALCTRAVPLPTSRPAVAPTPPRADLSNTLGLDDDDDLLPQPDSSSPPPGDGDPPSDMDISPLAEPPPPRLRPDPPPHAATHSPVARRTLSPYLVWDPPSWRTFGLGPDYPLTRAVALASGDKSIPHELLPRLNSVLRETRLAGGVFLRDVVRLATGDYGDPAPPPPGSTTAPHGSRVKAMARRLQGAARRPAGPAPPAAAPRALTQLTLPPSPPPRGSSRSASPSDIDSGQISVVLNAETDLDLSASESSDSRCPSPPAAAPQYTSPSPPHAPTGRVAQWSWRSALVPKVLGSKPAFSTKHDTCLFTVVE